MNENVIYPFLDLKTVNEPLMERLRQAALRVVNSGRYVGGEECSRFENMLAAMTGTRFAVGVSNGLDALRLIFRACIETGRFKPGDEVIVPANTYIASVLAVSDCGLKPVMVDADPSTMNLDLTKIEASLTPRTVAVMVVHLYGRVCWSEEFEAMAKRRGLFVVEDNAQAIGASWNGRFTGSLGDAAAFSFYPTKNIGALGDAGAVTTDSGQIAETVRALANYGSDRRYHNIYRGLNCRLDPIQAAFLCEKLPFTEEENSLRRETARIYLENISNKRLILPEMPSDERGHVFHQFVVRADNRQPFTTFLSEKGVGWDIAYATPPFRQPCYAADFPDPTFPEADAIADHCVSLPISRCTTPDDARQISAIINNWK